MLKSIDTLLGLALVMLVASMGVTVLTQIWTGVFNTRGVHLRDGLGGMIRQLDPRLSTTLARTIAEQVLKHPLIGNGGRLGPLVHREEFTRVLLELAGGGGAGNLPEVARRALADALRANGIEDPAAVLTKIRDLALALELSSPSLSAGARHDLAILQAASSDFVAKVNGWFDHTIDRVRVRFTFATHKIALANALLVACAMQLDTVALVNRLATDDGLRATLVGQATARGNLPAGSLSEIEGLAGQKLFPLPWSGAGWAAHWSPDNVPGVVLSVLLLSLGAPFWFEALKNLLRLRSAIAVKDESQRENMRNPVEPVSTNSNHF